MIGQSISHYKILEKLGEGGMGVVYKAQDLKLNRPVALKFLPQHIIAKPVDKARFLQEAQAAALLNHPNICAIYGIHDDGDEHFIELEYVEGVTIREHLPIQKTVDVLDLAIQIGEGLLEAHAKEIVHRDIKSENIMVNSRGQVKIMDFGLAKLKGSPQLTQSSTTVGTLAYTAPEQVRGAPSDIRSDIFSFGVVLYEMLAGRVPFRGEHPAALMYSIVHEDPEPLEQYRPNTPPDIVSIVGKALEKDPSDRYQSVAELVVDLKRARRKTSAPSTFPPDESDMRKYDNAAQKTKSTTTPHVRQQSRRTFLLSAGVGLLVIAAMVAGYFLLPGHDEPLTSLAVMPFVNSTGDQNLEYLTDGMTENIISNLSKLADLRVMSRGSVFRYKGKDIAPDELGKTLHVRAVLTGRMTQRPDGFLISLELVDTKDNRQIWGDHYTRTVAALSSLETEIPRKVSERLQLKLSGDDRKNLSTGSTSNSEAYQLYLKGRFNWNKRTPEALQRAIDFYKQAIEKDPTFVQSYVGLAETYVLLPVYFYRPPKDALENAQTYAEKALELDPHRSEAFSVLGYAMWSQMNIEEAERNFLRAIELNPRHATTHQWYAIALSSWGRHDEALSEIKKAIELDPLSLIIQDNFGIVLNSAGRQDEAMTVVSQVIEVEPSFPMAHYALGGIHLRRGNPEKALEEYQKAAGALGGIVLPEIAGTSFALGRKEETQKALAQFEQLMREGVRAEAQLAIVYLAKRDKSKALEWLEKLRKSQFINITYFFSIRNFVKISGLDTDPEIQVALKNIGVN